MQQVVTITKDDIDRSDAVETVSFGLDGKWYLIDLNEEHSEQLREQIDYWKKYARRDKSRSVRSRRANRSLTFAGQVRSWATANGIPVNKRGKVPATLIERFNQSQAAGGS